jgi:hypothetical protein
MAARRPCAGNALGSMVIGDVGAPSRSRRSPRQEAALLGPQAREDEEGQTEPAPAPGARPLVPRLPPRSARSRASGSRQEPTFREPGFRQNGKI